MPPAPIHGLRDLTRCVGRLEKLGHRVILEPDYRGCDFVDLP